MTYIDEETDRRTLEIAAIFDCEFDLELIEKLTDEELRKIIIDWIEEYSEV